MGLNCSHSAFDGSYSAFNAFRQCVAAALGGSFPPHYVYGMGGVPQEAHPGSLMLKRQEGSSNELLYWGDGYSESSHPGLHSFFALSDWDDALSPEVCVAVAGELEELLPKIEGLGWEVSGHLKREGGYLAVTRRFISGCLAAASMGEPLLFR